MNETDINLYALMWLRICVYLMIDDGTKRCVEGEEVVVKCQGNLVHATWTIVKKKKKNKD